MKVDPISTENLNQNINQYYAHQNRCYNLIIFTMSFKTLIINSYSDEVYSKTTKLQNIKNQASTTKNQMT